MINSIIRRLNMDWMRFTDLIRIFWVCCFCTTAFFALRTFFLYGWRHQNTKDLMTIATLIRLDFIKSILISLGGLGILFIFVCKFHSLPLLALFYFSALGGFLIEAARQIIQYLLIEKLRKNEPPKN